MTIKLHIQGVSSWVGSYMVDYVQENNLDIEITGTYRSNIYNSNTQAYNFLKIQKNLDALIKLFGTQI